MKRYLLVSGDFAPWGGMDRANLALAETLLRRGHALEVVAHRLTVDVAAWPRLRFHRVHRPAGSHWLGAPLLRRTGLARAADVARAGGRVVVNGGNCPWGDANWVHYVHAGHAPAGGSVGARRWIVGWKHRSHIAHERVALGRARCVIANSERTRRECIEHLGVSPERIRTIYYGIDAAVFRPPTAEERAMARVELAWAPNRPVLLFVGGLGDRRKGLDTLLTAWERRGVFPDGALLAIVGAGAELARWRVHVTRRGLAQSVQFLGFRTDVPRLLGAADALVAPTRYEAYGLGVHEALCCSLPALVSAHAGVAERYPETLRSLLLADPDDAEGLANAIGDVLALDPVRRRQVTELGTALRQRDWSAMAGDVIEWIESTSPGASEPSGRRR